MHIHPYMYLHVVIHDVSRSIAEKSMANYPYVAHHLFVFFPSFVYVLIIIIYANLEYLASMMIRINCTHLLQQQHLMILAYC
jgi:hypothetical protein